VQSSSLLALFRCLNHLRFSSTAEVSIPVCCCCQRLKQSPKTHCLRQNFRSRLPIETPPPPFERSLDDGLSHAKNRRHPTPNVPPCAAQRICLLSCIVTHLHVLGCSPCHVSISKHATSALDPHQQHVSPRPSDC
jgi:hypothetical protein